MLKALIQEPTVLGRTSVLGNLRWFKVWGPAGLGVSVQGPDGIRPTPAEKSHVEYKTSDKNRMFLDGCRFWEILGGLGFGVLPVWGLSFGVWMGSPTPAGKSQFAKRFNTGRNDFSTAGGFGKSEKV